MTDIYALIASIPEDSRDEALMSIQTVITLPPDAFRIRCHLTHEFRITARVAGRAITLHAEDWPSATCSEAGFLGALKRMVHQIDEAIEAGRYAQNPPKPTLIYDMPPPRDLDIPVWDEKRRRWYDAEY